MLDTHCVRLPLNPQNIILSNVYEVVQFVNVEFIVLDYLSGLFVHLSQKHTIKNLCAVIETNKRTMNKLIKMRLIKMLSVYFLYYYHLE